MVSIYHYVLSESNSLDQISMTVEYLTMLPEPECGQDQNIALPHSSESIQDQDPNSQDQLNVLQNPELRTTKYLHLIPDTKPKSTDNTELHPNVETTQPGYLTILPDHEPNEHKYLEVLHDPDTKEAECLEVLSDSKLATPYYLEVLPVVETNKHDIEYLPETDRCDHEYEEIHEEEGELLIITALCKNA